MEPECSLPWSQQATHLLPYSKPDNPVHSLSSYFIMVSFNVRFYSCLDLPGGPFPSGLHTKNSVCICPPPPRKMYHVPPISWTSIWSSLYLALSTTRHNIHYAILCHIFFATSFLGSQIFFSTLFSKTLSLCSSRQGEERSFTPAQTTGKILVLFVFNFCFYTTNGKVKSDLLNGNRYNQNLMCPWFFLVFSLIPFSHFQIFETCHNFK